MLTAVFFTFFSFNCLCIWLAIHRNHHLRNATRMVSEFFRAIHWSPVMFPIPPLYYLWLDSLASPGIGTGQLPIIKKLNSVHDLSFSSHSFSIFELLWTVSLVSQLRSNLGHFSIDNSNFRTGHRTEPLNPGHSPKLTTPLHCECSVGGWFSVYTWIRHCSSRSFD